MNKYRAKHMRNKSRIQRFRKKHMMRKRRYLNMKPLVALVLMGSIAGTTAFLKTTNNIKNEFIVGEVIPEIKETFNYQNKVKEDVYFKNSGNVPIYIRAAITIKWKDNSGKILEESPIENVDYIINFSNSLNWLESEEGYYYYKTAIDENKNTDILIEECTQIRQYDDKFLEVSILAQGIQAEPNNAVEEAWDVNIVSDDINLGGE